MTLPQLFDLSFVSGRERPAIQWAGKTYTFGEVDARASRMAHALVRRGIKPGDRLCIYLPNCLEYIDVFLACTRLGVIFVPINILYRGREIRHILADAEPVAVIASSESSEHIADHAPVWLLEELARETLSESEARSSFVFDGDAPAAIIYTSGT